MILLKQNESTFVKYLIWYGVCGDSRENYDFVKHEEILSVIEYDSTGILSKTFDRPLGENFWDITSFEEGHAYIITLSKGAGEISIPNAYVSNSEILETYKLSDTCVLDVHLTPTPTPKKTPTPVKIVDCCDSLSSVTIDNDIHGVSLQVEGENFENGILCFEVKSNVVYEPSDTESYFLKTSSDEFVASVSIARKGGLTNFVGFTEDSFGRFVYKLPNGDCYEGDFSLATKNDYNNPVILDKIEKEKYQETYPTPSSLDNLQLTPTPLGSGLDKSVDYADGSFGSLLFSAGKNEYGESASSEQNLTFEQSYVPSYSVFSLAKNHFVYLLNDGTLNGGGIAKNGQLGDSTRLGTDESSLDVPDEIFDINAEDIRDVKALGGCSFVLKTDNSVFAFGINQDGELGTGDSLETQVTTLSKLQIEDAKYFLNTSNAPSNKNTLYIVKNNGDIYGCGSGQNNNLFLGDDVNNYLVPTKTPFTDKDIISISMTEFCTLVLKTDGSVYSTGNYGRNGVGGSGKWNDENTKFMYKINKSSNKTEVYNDFSDVMQISSNGKDAVVALKIDGTVWTWGIGEDILGTGDTREYSDGFSYDGSLSSLPNRYSTRGRTIPTKVDISDVNYVGMSRKCCYAVKNDGTLWVWGTDMFGESGLGKSGVISKPTQINFGIITPFVEKVIGGYYTSFVKIM